MAVYYLRKKKGITEDEDPENDSENNNNNRNDSEKNNTNDAVIQDLNHDLVQKNEEEIMAKSDFDNKIRTNGQMKDQIRNKIAASADDPVATKSFCTQLVQLNIKEIKMCYDFATKTRDIRLAKEQIKQMIIDAGGTINEQARGFGRRLYESVTNRTDEMFALISLTFDSMDGLSYRPDSTRCRTFAKNIIAYINKGDFGEAEPEQGLSDFLINLLNRSQVSLSNKEKDAFVINLIDNMKESALFSWIFKNEK